MVIMSSGVRQTFAVRFFVQNNLYGTTPLPTCVSIIKVKNTILITAIGLKVLTFIEAIYCAAVFRCNLEEFLIGLWGVNRATRQLFPLC